MDITKVVFLHGKTVKNDYHHDSRVFYAFIFNKLLGQLLDSPPKKFVVLKAINSEFLYIKICFTDQNFKPIEIEDKINIILVIIDV